MIDFKLKHIKKSVERAQLCQFPLKKTPLGAHIDKKTLFPDFPFK